MVKDIINYLPVPHSLVTSLSPTKNFVLQPPQLSKTQRALRKFGHISSSQAVAALIHSTMGTPGGQGPVGGAGDEGGEGEVVEPKELL